MENDFSLREWEILRFFVFIARNEKNTKMMVSEERDSKKPNISSFLGVFILEPNPKERTDHKSYKFGVIVDFI